MQDNIARELSSKLNPKDLKPLFKTNPYRHAGAMLFNWMIIILVIVANIQLQTFWFYFLSVIVIGARMHALAILMHDATHYRFLKNRKWNDLITNITTMYPIFTTIQTYRTNHLNHHQHLNTDHDPDWVAKLGKREFQFPKTKKEFLLTIASYIVLYQGIMDAFWFLKRFGGNKKKGNGKSENKTIQIIFNIVLFTCLTIFGAWKYYLLLWIVPYFSTFFMFQYIRSVAEHFGELAYEDDLSASRTVKPTLLERFIIAPHHVGYHLEHHLFPGVPFYHLPKLHQLLMEQDVYKTKAHITQGYTSGLLNELGSNSVVSRV